MSLISTRGWCPIVRASAASLTNSLAASLFIEILMVQITYIEHNGMQHNVDVLEGESLMQAAQNNMISGIDADRLEEHTSEIQLLMRISYAVLCLIQILLHTSRLSTLITT